MTDACSFTQTWIIGLQLESGNGVVKRDLNTGSNTCEPQTQCDA